MTDDCEQRLEELQSYIDSEIEPRLDALARAKMHAQDRIDELEDENERLRERVAELSKIVAPDPERTEYESLTRPQKVHRLRVALVEQAATQANGKSMMTYRDVQWLFDGQPSAYHAYTIMELAGELDGFSYDTDQGDQIRILANLDATKDETLICAANKARRQETA